MRYRKQSRWYNWASERRELAKKCLDTDAVLGLLP